MILRASHPDFWRFYELLAQSQIWLSPIHGIAALQYYRQLSIDKGEHTEDRSFIVLQGEKPVAAFLGVIVGNAKKNLSFFDIPCISIEAADLLAGGKASKEFLFEFDMVTESVIGEIRYRDFAADGQLSVLARHLLSRGAAPETVLHRVINLHDDEIELRRNIRKSYRSLINWGLRELAPQIVTHEDLSWGQMEAFRTLHFSESGRATRSETSWRRLYEWVKAGSAFVVLGHLHGELVSAGLFEYNRKNCFYGVSVSRRDLFERPLFHALMWVAILHAKRLGCSWFDVGKQVFPKHPSAPLSSVKELGISEFKAGFGGNTRIQLELNLIIENKVILPEFSGVQK